MEGYKYELSDETIDIGGRILNRIKALKNFCDVKKGELGGFVESERNLSQYGSCWIYDDAKVYGQAMILDNAHIYNTARAYGYATIKDNAKVFNEARIESQARICGNTKIYGNANIGDIAVIKDYIIRENAWIRSKKDIFSVNGFGSVQRTTYFYRGMRDDIYVVCGCFHGSLEQFREQVIITYPNPDEIYRIEYLKIADLAEYHFKNTRLYDGD